MFPISLSPISLPWFHYPQPSISGSFAFKSITVTITRTQWCAVIVLSNPLIMPMRPFTLTFAENARIPNRTSHPRNLRISFPSKEERRRATCPNLPPALSWPVWRVASQGMCRGGASRALPWRVAARRGLASQKAAPRARLRVSLFDLRRYGPRRWWIRTPLPSISGAEYVVAPRGHGFGSSGSLGEKKGIKLVLIVSTEGDYWQKPPW